MIAELLAFMASALYGFLIQFHADSAFNQDLGRHIKLGELIMESFSVPATNLFTYTFGTYQFVNHHWLSEIIFFLLHQTFGLPGLMILKLFLFALVGLATWLCFTENRTRRWIFYLTQIILLPLFLERPDLRPEVFGYAFFAYFLFLLHRRRNIRFLLLIPPIMLLWVNMHITFVFGYLLLGLLFIRYRKAAVPFILAALAVLLLNPRGLYGALFPFLIFNDYGYAITENQNILFLLTNTNNIHLRYFLLLTPLYAITVGTLMWKKKYILSAVFSVFLVASCVQSRHLPFFVITAGFAVPEALHILHEAFSPLFKKLPQIFNLEKIFIGMYVLLVFLLIFFYRNISTYNKLLTLRFDNDYAASADFVLANKLPGKIFNSFDNGGYLDYRFYPKYLTFVDNRPDAFPSSFFTTEYIPMQMDEKVWDKTVRKYGIRTIVFPHTDQTPWAQSFVQRIIADKKWKMVYLDGTTVILTTGTAIRDRRNDTDYLQKALTIESDPRKLLYFARALMYIGHENLMVNAVKKAHDIDPDSCAVNKALLSIYATDGTQYYAAAAESIRNDHWYCF